MKKISLLLGTLLLITSLAACGLEGEMDNGASGGPNSDLPGSTVKESTIPETPAAITALKFTNQEPVTLEIDSNKTLQLYATSTGYQMGFDAFCFISSDPSVLEVSVSNVLSTAISGKAVPKSPGVVDVFCSTADGKIKSDPIQVKVIQNTEHYTDDLSTCTVDAIKISSENIWLKSGTTSKMITGTYEAIFPQDGRFIEWVSSDPSVVEIKPKVFTDHDFIVKSYTPPISATLLIHKDGQAQIYAQTKGGKVKSEPIMLTVGNQYNPEQIAKTDVENYIKEHLKYPSITNRELAERKEAYINNYFHPWEDQKNYTYKDHTEYSKVTINNLNVSETLVTADGKIQTFNASGTPTNCTFKIQLQYQSDFKSYEVKSEQYSSPELIVKEID